MVSNGVNEVSMPKIGCGLDNLKWEFVYKMIIDIFQNTNIKVNVFYIKNDANWYQIVCTKCEEYTVLKCKKFGLHLNNNRIKKRSDYQPVLYLSVEI